MSLPDERARAIKKAREFLRRLLSPYGEEGIKGVPKEVRRGAYSVLRHFPTDLDLVKSIKKDSPISGELFEEKEKE